MIDLKGKKLYRVLDLGGKLASIKTSKLEFGYFDAKGRELGAMATTWTEQRTAITEAEIDGRSYNLGEAGEWFGVRFQKTKGGRAFGASQPGKYFKTRAERDSFMAAEWLRRMKRAEKENGK